MKLLNSKANSASERELGVRPEGVGLEKERLRSSFMMSAGKVGQYEAG